MQIAYHIFVGCLMLQAFFVGALMGGTGAAGFATGLGVASTNILKKISLV